MKVTIHQHIQRWSSEDLDNNQHNNEQQPMDNIGQQQH
jgi:hypothetical protein